MEYNPFDDSSVDAGLRQAVKMPLKLYDMVSLYIYLSLLYSFDVL